MGRHEFDSLRLTDVDALLVYNPSGKVTLETRRLPKLPARVWMYSQFNSDLFA
jgi:hypothetical protein